MAVCFRGIDAIEKAQKYVADYESRTQDRFVIVKSEKFKYLGNLMIALCFTCIFI